MKTKRTNITAAAPLVLLAFFAVLAATVLLTGATLYRSRTESGQIAWEKRTASRYLSMRIRQSDTAGAFFVGDFDTKAPGGSGDTFFALEMHDGVLYSTRIYVWEGKLCELFAPHDADFDRGDGEVLTALSDLHFTLAGDRLGARLRFADGTEQELFFTMRSSGEALP
ncbi:MAG: DUF4860 domain-containing protein [Ruminococcaceae bacterium]|nr:DUF4860 domain-containing protein [Oscillospiraceae bacterium]